MIPYADFAEQMGFGAGNDSPLLADGDTVLFEVRDGQSGELLDGARLFVGEVEIPGELGRFRIPVDHTLVKPNPNIRLVLPPQHEGPVRFSFGVDFTMSQACGGEKAAATRALVVLDAWQIIPVGPDRIYLEPPYSPSDAAHLERLLREARAFLVEVSGVEPPPIAIGMMSDTAPERYARGDRDQRTVWLAGAARSREDGFIGFIVHEWTHGLLKQLGFPRDSALRYIEDGLAELLGHLAEQRLLGRALTPVWESRAKELEAGQGDDRVDLFALATKYDHSGLPAEFLTSQCRPGVSRGYALGMAYWLGRTHGRVDAAREQITMLKADMPHDAAGAASLLSQTGPTPRNFTLAQARAWMDEGRAKAP